MLGYGILLYQARANKHDANRRLQAVLEDESLSHRLIVGFLVVEHITLTWPL